MFRVSVVTPAYNPGRPLRETLDSVQKQTFSDWELVVVDDGSAEDLSWVAAVDPRIRLVRQANGGPSVARNRGVAETTGHYLAFLDADDCWLPQKLERQAGYLDAHPEIALCHTRFEQITKDGSAAGAGFGRHVKSYAELLRGSAILTSSVLVRRECVAAAGGFDPRYRGPEDYDFFLRIARQFPTAFLDEVLVRYRVTDGSLSNNFARMYRQSRQVLREHERWARAHGQLEAAAAARDGIRSLGVSHCCINFNLARQRKRERRWGAMVKCLCRAMAIRPGYVARELANFGLPRDRAATVGESK